MFADAGFCLRPEWIQIILILSVSLKTLWWVTFTLQFMSENKLLMMKYLF